MKVLLVHAYYTQRGGEDAVYENELAALTAAGISVEGYPVRNAELAAHTGRLTAAKQVVWNPSAGREVVARARAFGADVVHFHNTFPFLSNASIAACAEAGLGTVQTIHNFRLGCAAATLIRDGERCELCVGRRLALPALRYRCYRDSAAATAPLVAMQAAHRNLRWHRQVGRYIAISRTVESFLVRQGIPAEKVVVKPNVVPEPGAHEAPIGDHFVFVGRVTREKGVPRLLEAWRSLPYPLRIVGDGDERPAFMEMARDLPNVTWLGSIPREQVDREVASALGTIVPSEWDEPFGMVAVESMALGTPVLTTGRGGLADIIDDLPAALTYRSGDAADLASKVPALAALGRDPAMRRLARARYEARYTPAAHVAAVTPIYEDAIRAARR